MLPPYHHCFTKGGWESRLGWFLSSYGTWIKVHQALVSSWWPGVRDMLVVASGLICKFPTFVELVHFECEKMAEWVGTHERMRSHSVQTPNRMRQYYGGVKTCFYFSGYPLC